MQKYNVAIVGATGAVGVEILRMLIMREFPLKKLTLLASERSAGKLIKIDESEQAFEVESFSEDKFKHQSLVFFATSGEHATIYAPKAVAAGAIVIDNSSAFRLNDDVPLIVPEVNPEAIKLHKGIIANPNCSTIQMVVALNPLHQFSKIKRIVVSTYQAVSGAGQAAIEELEQQLESKGNVNACDSSQPKSFTKPIAYNVIPHIDVFLDNGYTKEEMKMVNETWKIIGDDQIKISATCVRVPVIRAHSEAINIETEEFIGEVKARQLLAQADGIEVVDMRQDGGYPTPIEASQTIPTYVGRIRDDISCDNGLALWCVSDQLWKGAALNAVQIAELLIDDLNT